LEKKKLHVTIVDTLTKEASMEDLGGFRVALVTDVEQN
jgi:hypothetical protein